MKETSIWTRLFNPNLKNKEIYPGLSLNLPRLTRKFTTSKDEIKEVKKQNNCSYNNLTTNTIIPLSLLYKNYFDTLIICNEQDNLYDELIDELIDEKKLGEGSFGVVYKGTFRGHSGEKKTDVK